MLQSVEHLCRVRVRSRVSVDARLLKVMSYRRDLMRIGNTLNLSRTDMLRVFLGSVDVPRLTDDAHRQAADWFDQNAHASSESASGTSTGPAPANDETVAWQASSDSSRHKRGRVTA